MLKVNNLFFGLLIAAVATAVAVGLLWLLNFELMEQLGRDPVVSETFLLILGVAINLLPLQFYTKANAFQTARGILAFVFIFAAWMLFTYWV